MTTNALWVSGISARDARVNMAGLVASNSTNPLNVRTGVLWTGVADTQLLKGTATTSPSMTVTLDRFHYVAYKATGDGPYIGCHDASENLNIAAAPASGSRIDVVYIMQRDSDAPTAPDGSIIGEVGVVTGTASATPSKPAIPTGALEIGTVTVAAGATKTTDPTVTIATTVLYTAAKGAPIPVRNTTERAGITAYEGRQVLRLDLDGMVQTYNGSQWEGSITKAGSFTYAGKVDAGTGAVAVPVTFPSAFPGTPQAVTVAPGSARLGYTISARSTTGFTCSFDNWSPSNTSVGFTSLYIATYYAN